MIKTAKMWRFGTNGKLRFPDDLELRFQTYYARRYRRQMQLGLAICLVGLIAALLFHAFFVPELLHSFRAMRLGSMLVLSLLLLMIVGSRYRSWQQSALLAATSVIALHALILASIVQPPLRYTALSGLMIAMLAVSTLLRLQFRYVAVYAVIFMLGVYSWLQWLQEVPRMIISIMGWLTLGMAMSLVNSWLLERAVRRNYLQTRLLQIEKAQSKTANAQLKQLLDRDALTGVANRRRFDEVLQSEWRRAQRAGQALSLLMIDIDEFKKYNDHFGHPQGDVCLRQVAQALERSFQRAGELVARYGGEEFVVVLPSTDAARARACAEQARLAVMALKLAHAPNLERAVITISIGAATQTSSMEQLALQSASAVNLLQSADRALYAAKHAGRNRSVHAADITAMDS